ncbi:Gfo/Idh/MocA family protein [Pontibacillus salicampi]|uniref:Gfo/Idh/MocA family protein n=1 Tax=Pontibacillus salicampi TaxID=1449801 RepID=A0ABV6LR45_9BACI
MPLTVCVIGAGIIAQEHLKAAMQMDELEVLAIAEIHNSRRIQTCEQYEIRGYTFYEEMVLVEKPDIVVITLPHHLHKDAALFCAKHNAHILLEKPMGINEKECRTILSARNENNIELMVGHTQHYFIENQAAREIVASERLGKLLSINETRHLPYFTEDRPSWFLENQKAGGGIMMNLGSHCIDKIQWITNSNITSVTAHLTYPPDFDIEGSGMIWCTTTKNIPICITISGYEGVPRHETEFIFSNGMMKMEVGKGIWISEGNQYKSYVLPSQSSLFQGQLSDLVKAIYKEKPLECTGEYAASIINVIEKIYESHHRKATILV